MKIPQVIKDLTIIEWFCLAATAVVWVPLVAILAVVLAMMWAVSLSFGIVGYFIDQIGEK